MNKIHPFPSLSEDCHHDDEHKDHKDHKDHDHDHGKKKKDHHDEDTWEPWIGALVSVFIIRYTFFMSDFLS